MCKPWNVFSYLHKEHVFSSIFILQNDDWDNAGSGSLSLYTCAEDVRFAIQRPNDATLLYQLVVSNNKVMKKKGRAWVVKVEVSQGFVCAFLQKKLTFLRPWKGKIIFRVFLKKLQKNWAWNNKYRVKKLKNSF